DARSPARHREDAPACRGHEASAGRTRARRCGAGARRGRAQGMRPADGELAAQAMQALEAELGIAPELEARLLDAALGDDRAAEAMRALDEQLVIPRALEARLINAVAPPSAITPKAARRSFAKLGVWLAAAAASIGVVYAGARWPTDQE